MFVIPYGYIQMKSSLKSTEIENRLNEELEPQRFISGIFRGSHKYFEGELNNGQFKISRVIEGRNSFNPVVTGKIQQEINYNVIDMKIRMDLLVVILFLSILATLFFSMVWSDISLLFSVFVFGEGRGLYEILPENHFFLVMIPFIIFALFLYLFVIIPFNIEASKAIEYLEHLFVSQETSQ